MYSTNVVLFLETPNILIKYLLALDNLNSVMAFQR